MLVILRILFLSLLISTANGSDDHDGTCHSDGDESCKLTGTTGDDHEKSKYTKKSQSCSDDTCNMEGEEAFSLITSFKDWKFAEKQVLPGE